MVESMKESREVKKGSKSNEEKKKDMFSVYHEHLVSIS